MSHLLTHITYPQHISLTHSYHSLISHLLTAHLTHSYLIHTRISLTHSTSHSYLTYSLISLTYYTTRLTAGLLKVSFSEFKRGLTIFGGKPPAGDAFSDSDVRTCLVVFLTTEFQSSCSEQCAFCFHRAESARDR